MCVLVVCFVLVNEVRFVQVLINKYVKVFCFSRFVSPVLTAHIVKQLRVRAKGQTARGAQTSGGDNHWQITVMRQVLS